MSSGTAFPESGDVYLFTPLKKFSPEDVFEFTATEGVATAPPGAVDGFELQAIYPNPFVDAFSVTYVLQTPARVTMTLHDMLGREVSRHFAGEQPPGEHVVRTNPALLQRANLASGTYIVRLSIQSPQGTLSNHTLPVTRVR